MVVVDNSSGDRKGWHTSGDIWEDSDVDSDAKVSVMKAGKNAMYTVGYMLVVQ